MGDLLVALVLSSVIGLCYHLRVFVAMYGLDESQRGSDSELDLVIVQVNEDNICTEEFSGY